MFFATMVVLTPNSARRLLTRSFRMSPNGDLGDAHVAVRVALDAGEAGEVLLVHPLDERLRR